MILAPTGIVVREGRLKTLFVRFWDWVYARKYPHLIARDHQKAVEHSALMHWIDSLLP